MNKKKAYWITVGTILILLAALVAGAMFIDGVKYLTSLEADVDLETEMAQQLGYDDGLPESVDPRDSSVMKAYVDSHNRMATEKLLAEPLGIFALVCIAGFILANRAAARLVPEAHIDLLGGDHE